MSHPIILVNQLKFCRKEKDALDFVATILANALAINVMTYRLMVGTL
jgi:hypothetical protein